MFGYCAGNPRRVWVSASPSSCDDRQPDSTTLPLIELGSNPAALLALDAPALAASLGGAALSPPPVLGAVVAPPLLQAATMTLDTSASTRIVARIHGPPSGAGMPHASLVPPGPGRVKRR